MFIVTRDLIYVEMKTEQFVVWFYREHKDVHDKNLDFSISQILF